MVEAENFNVQATEAYNNKDFATAAALFQQAFDLDPLQHTYSLNAGLGYYEAKQYDNAIQLFDLALTSKNETTKERALRFKGLSLYAAGRAPEACAVFLRLKNKYPKRMYEQEFRKYCFGENNK